MPHIACSWGVNGSALIMVPDQPLNASRLASLPALAVALASECSSTALPAPSPTAQQPQDAEGASSADVPLAVGLGGALLVVVAATAVWAVKHHRLVQGDKLPVCLHARASKFRWHVHLVKA